jgi:histidine phosphotransferase ChpT
MSSEAHAVSPSSIEPQPPQGVELAATVAAKICHDLISPISAIVSGLDLMEDDQSQDMREEAMNLIAQSARKLAAQLSFARVAFGASASADTFDPRELEKLVRGIYETVRADLDWAVQLEALNKPAARALLNVAQIGAGVLPMGGTARLTAEARDRAMVIGLEARGQRVRMRAETAEGLRGEPVSDGLPGQWIQAYYLYALVKDAGGQVEFSTEDGLASVQVVLPL